jgi:hypothetical protein
MVTDSLNDLTAVKELKKDVALKPNVICKEKLVKMA